LRQWHGRQVGARRAPPPEGLLPRCLEIAKLIQACSEASVREQIQVFSRNDGAPLDVALAAEEYVVRRWRLSHP